MPGIYPDGFDEGYYLPTSEVFDVGDLQEAGISNENFRELLIRLAQKINKINITINNKENGIYPEEEIINGQLWFPDLTLSSSTGQLPEPRQVFRKVINIGALLNAATKTVSHEIVFPATSTITRIYGGASDTTNQVFIPLPFVSQSGAIAAGDTELYADDTNVYITPTGDATSFDTCYVVLEYLKY